VNIDRTPLTVIRCLILVVIAALSSVDVAATREPQPEHARLVELVREATTPFLDVQAALDADYEPAFGCVSGPQEGAMGVHYINMAYVLDGVLDPAKPEALMYEIKGGKARFLGVEFIVDAEQWLKANGNKPPALEEQAFQLVTSPNRYALGAFFELHVWAWRDNPKGMFADWNPKVTCNGR
jgi:hypothetical protein